jgi:hypothetical protein
LLAVAAGLQVVEVVLEDIDLLYLESHQAAAVVQKFR